MRSAGDLLGSLDRRRSSLHPVRRHRLAVAGLAAVAALLVYAVAHGVFPYHTSNHDEAVYLQQAAMLLDGQLYLSPPVTESFHPWFFVESDAGLYPKYSPVPAAMFAVGKLLGGYRIALALIAAGVVALTARVGSEVFGRRTGYLAAVLLLASPLFLLNASVFLPYVPTTLWNLAFAAAYLHADRTGSRRAAAVAGLAVAAAFFARPYTAVLFAAPFVAHAVWTLRTLDRPVLLRQSLTGAFGLLGVVAALGYNAVVTGDPLLFPYEAFAPRDGLGFGQREILGYERDYTPALALRANAEVLWAYAARWVVAGALGTLAAFLGLAVAARRGLSDRQAVVAGIGLTVPLGNVYFWGNLNVLGDLDAAGDGLISYLGPYYHVDLLVPTALFAAVGLRFAGQWIREAVRSRPLIPPRTAVAALLVGAAVIGAAGVGATAAPLADNYAVTERYETAYEPVEDRSFEHALVFLPTPYGDWLNHPFQALRNDPGYDGDAVYALRDRQFAVVDAFPDRTLYRYTYRGPWAPTAGATVEPHLQEIRHVRGESVYQDVAAGVPDGAELIAVEIAASGQRDSTTVTAPSSFSGTLTVSNGTATLAGPALDDSLSVPVDGRETVETSIFVDYGTGAGFTYRLEHPVDAAGGAVRALTPYAEVCRGADRCGGESAYVPGAHRDGIRVNATIHD
ncbi:DUF7846 domain-containing protein [Halomicrobium urmianum]|uniref:DUF7846 domain-containing protein n=1 Tax=Halomicrobium urmianum TaxID=1586233 RepID=UPI001CD9EF96|nr:hypothetical protein [Halomicrobium urmianum]